MTTAPLSIPTADDYLGPADQRFFGGGFRRVQHRLTDIRVLSHLEGGAIRARATVSYPPDWSAKSTGRELVPHLSTIDALVLGAQLAEIHLTYAFGLDAELRSWMWLRRVVVRAGSSAQEDLGRIDVRSTYRVDKAYPIGPGVLLSTVEAQIGTMTVVCEVQHDDTGYRTTDDITVHTTAEELLGARAGRYYADDYRRRGQRVEDLRVGVDPWRVDASVWIEPTPHEEAGLARGMEAAYAPSASMIDAIAAVGQMAQVLLYELDGIERGASETLWLRRAELACATPYRPLDEAFPAHTTIAKSQLLTTAGGVFRTCALDYSLHGITGTYSVAHRIPDPMTRGAGRGRKARG